VLLQRPNRPRLEFFRLFWRHFSENRTGLSAVERSIMASQDTPLRRNPARSNEKQETPNVATNKSSHTSISEAYTEEEVEIGAAVARTGQHVNLNPAKLKKGTRVWAKFCTNSNSKKFQVFPAQVLYLTWNEDGTLKSVHLRWLDNDRRNTNRNPEQVFFRELELEQDNLQSPEPVLPVTPTASNSRPVSSAPRETGNAKHKKKRRLSTPPKSDSSSDSDDCIIVENTTPKVAKLSAGTGSGGSFHRVPQAQQKLSADEESAALRAGKAPATHIDSSTRALPQPYESLVIGIVEGEAALKIQAAFRREEENPKRTAKSSGLEGSSSSSVSRALSSAFNKTDSDGALVGSSHRPASPPVNSDGALVGSSHRPASPPVNSDGASVGSSHRPPPPSNDSEGGAVGSSDRPQKVRKSAATESPRPPPPPDDFRSVSPTASHDDDALAAPVPDTDITASGRFRKPIQRYKCSAEFDELPSAYVGMSFHIPKKPVKKRGGGAKRL